jgi:hypothetical protein
MDMNEKTETLMTVIERLTGLLASENKNLSDRNVGAVGESVEEKDKLCKAFELLVRGLVKDGANIDEVETDLREELHSVGSQLKELVDNNVTSLKRAINANERLMDAVRSAAIECTPKAGSYTDSGSLSKGSRIGAKAPSPVTINQVL